MNSSITPAAVFRVLWEGKWILLGCALCVGAAVAFWSTRLPKIYSSTATIEYDPTPMQPLGSTVQDVANPINDYWSAREFFATQNEIIASRAVARKVVDRLGLHEDPDYLGVPVEGFEARDPGDIALRLAAVISVEPVENTRLVNITVTDRSPERAKTLADTVAQVYLEKTIEDRLSSTVAALDWLGNQLEDLRRELDESELALHSFKETHNILSVSMEERQNHVASEIETFGRALTEARTRRINVAAHVQRLRNAVGDDPLQASGSVFDERSELASLRETLRERRTARRQLATRSGGLGPRHPEVRALDAEIAALEAQLSEEVDSIVRNAERDLMEVRSVEGGLRAALNEANEAGLELGLREIEFQRLNRERENKAKLYELVLERATETDLTRMLRTTHVRIVDEGLVADYPIRPNNTLNTIAGTFGGGVLGLLILGLLWLSDRKIRDIAAVERVGLTVLGAIPKVAEGEDGPREVPKKGRSPLPGPSALFVHKKPMSTPSEAVRNLRTNIMFMSVGAEGSNRVYVVTSANPQEGKTTIASNLAASIALSGKSVLLIDTDLRRPRVHMYFGKKRNIGVSNVVAGESTLAEVAQPTFSENLSIVASGPIPPNPAELLHTAAFAAFVKEARETYDVVILDSPPLGAVTDAAIISTLADGAIVVVRVNKASRDGVRSTVRRLQSVNANLLGAVVNGVDSSAGGYSGYYGTDGRYYSEYQSDLDEDDFADEEAAQ